MSPTRKRAAEAQPKGTATPSVSYTIQGWNDVERSFLVVASTPTPIKRSEWDPAAGIKDDSGVPQGAMVEFWEALEGWNLERFAKNPIILESHDAGDIDAGIGLGSEIVQTADGGLTMKVTLAPLSASARSGELEQKIKAGILRGVSVGYDYGERSDEEREGKPTRVYKNNELCEVSLCLVPADADGLVRARTDSAEGSESRFDFIGSVGKFTRTAVGGIVVPARLTRTGILEYRRPDGTVRRELRLPDEVFNTESLGTLNGATVTNLDNHRGLLTAANWKSATLGHASEVRRDGKYVSAELHINDPATVAEVENKRLHDISCGYSCKLDHEAGVWEGQPYDAIQRNIRYNHVAVLPKGKGRAGPDVALRFDSRDAECVEAQQKDNIMTERVIRVDGKDLVYGSEPHIKHLEDAHLADLAKGESKAKELQTRCDSLEAERDVARTDAKKALADLKDEKDGEKAKSRRRSRERLLRRAVKLLATESDDEDDKMDALDELSDRDLQLKVIRSDANYKDDKSLDEKSDDYVSAIFDAVSKKFTRSDGIDSVVNTVEAVKRLDAKGTSVEDKAVADARAEMNKRLQNQWRTPAAS